jgi:GDSL-like Lipase/Acylhydrolase family
LVRLVLVNVVVFLCLAAATAAGAELWLRSTIPEVFEHTKNESIFEYSLTTPRYKTMRRDARVLAWGKELRTNELGFRDDDRTIAPKEAGEFRVVVLGDSFTVSAGVEYSDIYTSVLEARMREHLPKTRVINLGVAGYNVVQYALVLDEVGLSLDPDFIVIGLLPDNDFTNEDYETALSIASGRQSATLELAWYERLYVYRAYLRHVIYRLKRVWDRAVGQGVPQPGRGAEESPQGWIDNVAALRRISAVSKQRNAPLVVAVLPGTLLLEKQRPMFARMAAMCKDNGLVCVDMLERIKAEAGSDRLDLNPLDAHPNERYNRIAGTELASFILTVVKPR